jgi:glutathione S-transferase
VYRLFDSKLSSNSWKLRILMNELGIPFERTSLDLAKGEAKSAEFGKISRFQRVPVLELEDGRHIIESGAIMLFLAEGSDLLPSDPVERAEVTSWIFFEQGDLVKPLGLPRFFKLRGIYDEMHAKVAEMHETGYLALGKLEAWIKGREWLVNDRFSLADLAVFPYVSLAHVGGYEMDRFPGIQAWLRRLAERPSWEPLVAEGG